ncbi:MAG: porin, partial [Asticcacaulis sp.]
MKKSSLVSGVAAAVIALAAIASGASAQDTTISGRMYADFTNIDNKVDGVEKNPTGTGFDIKRLYIGIDHKFSDMFSANVTTDFQYSVAISSTDLYLKKAYLQAKFSDALVLRVGATDLQ